MGRKLRGSDVEPTLKVRVGADANTIGLFIIAEAKFGAPLSKSPGALPSKENHSSQKGPADAGVWTLRARGAAPA